MPPRFGVFTALFDSTPGYLDLLHLDSPQSKLVVSKIIECSRLSSDPFLEMAGMLDDANWRPHLVAAVGLSALGYDGTAFTRLWSAFDAGSWVTPQLAVAGYLRDPDFSEHARARVQARCPVHTDRLALSSPLEHHLALGPAGTPERSSKAASTLMYLLSLSGPSDWLIAQLAAPDLASLLSLGRDDGSFIAKAWLTSLKAILGSLAIKTD